MGLLNTADIRRIERRYEDGISSAVVVDLFQQKGERFSEATLRKYVQLGLLPKSRRVGARGRHRGSSGLYPVVIVKQINDIKAALEAGGTLEDIRDSRVGLAGELEVLERAGKQLLERMAGAIDKQDKGRRPKLKKEYDRAKKGLVEQVRELSKLANSLGSGKSGG